jgi:hypothetical protein
MFSRLCLGDTHDSTIRHEETWLKDLPSLFHQRAFKRERQSGVGGATDNFTAYCVSAAF